MQEIIIRKYEVNDEMSLQDLVKGGDPRYAEDLSEYERGMITAAEYNGVIAGYLWASISKGNCQIFVYVSPQYRRRGIGTALYGEAEKQCREKNEKSAYSHQYYEYEAGKAFAEKLGFGFTNGSVYMKYTGGVLPENEEKRGMIRKYRESDAERVHQIVARGFHALHIKLGYPPHMCVLDDVLNEDRRKEYESISAGSYVLEDGGKMVGFGNIDGANIGSLAVDMNANNKGYGKALALFMTNEILRRGNDTAYLWCEAGNDNAHHIYYNIGYREVETAYWSFKELK
jgi:ribosomal protein S18 acetylase RimI-like enzyme